MDETPSPPQATPALDPHAEIERLRELNRRWKHTVLAAVAGLGFVLVILVTQFAGTLFILSLLHEIRSNTAEANRDAAKLSREQDAAAWQVHRARGEAIQAAALIRMHQAEARLKREELLFEAFTKEVEDRSLQDQIANEELQKTRMIRLRDLDMARAELILARRDAEETILRGKVEKLEKLLDKEK
jgi:hypothetical protein